MADIKKELNDIKNAVYGREVRSSIHDGIKKINDESEESKQKAEEAHEITQDLLDESFDSAALEANFEQRLDNEISNLQPEWTEFKDNVTAQLAQIAVPITEFGASETLEDNTQPIQDAIDYVASMGGGVVLIPNGTFLIKGSTEDNIFLQSNVSIKGNGNQSILKINDNTGNWGAMFKIKDQYCENINISDFMIDCNSENTKNITETNRWHTTNRVPLFLTEGHSISVHNMKIICDGVWAIRGKLSYSRIYDNEIYFDVETYDHETYGSFDASSIWLGGEENYIYNNHLFVNENNPFTPATAIEFQGHRSQCYGNLVEGYGGGIIFTSSTSYENEYHVIDELGSNHTKIHNNIFICRSRGITIWPLNVPDGSIINGLMINDNTIKIVGNSTRSREGIRTYLGNRFSSVPSDADQTAPIHDLVIQNNLIEYENRNVDTSPFNGDHGLKLECDVEIDGLYIKNNTIKNVGGIGLYLHEPENEMNGVINNEVIKNFVIEGNTFVETKLPIWIRRNVLDGVIHQNTFMQNNLYQTRTDNMEVTVQSENSGNPNNKNVTIINNVIRTPKELKPFYPTNHLGNTNYTHYDRDRGFILEDNDVKLFDEQPSGKGVTINNTQFIRMIDGSIKKTTYGVGSTVGELKGKDGSAVKIIEGSETLLRVTDATNIEPGHVLSLQTGVFDTDVVTVRNVFKNQVRVIQNVGNPTLTEYVSVWYLQALVDA